MKGDELIEQVHALEARLQQATAKIIQLEKEAAELAEVATDRKPPHGIEADGGISDNGAAARTDDMNTIVQMGLAMEELQYKLSDCTLAREQALATVARLIEQARAAERFIADLQREIDFLRHDQPAGLLALADEAKQDKEKAEAALAEAVKERDEKAVAKSLLEQLTGSKS